jgi:hypothetical protein
MKLLVMTLVLASLSGCATSAVSYDKAKQVPTERLFLNSKDGTQSSITIIRDSGMMGGGCYIDVFINSDLAVTLDTAEKATFQVKPGEIFLGSQLSGNGLCFNNDVRHLEVTISQGQHKLYRVFTGQGGEVQIISAGILKN